jgi:hypothetical protein
VWGRWREFIDCGKALVVASSLKDRQFPGKARKGNVMGEEDAKKAGYQGAKERAVEKGAGKQEAKK